MSAERVLDRFHTDWRQAMRNGERARRDRRWLLRRAGGAVVVCLLLTIQTGCPAGKEFREAAGPAIKTGVNSVLDGLVDGFFAAFEPDNTAQTSSS
jgi:hypothetical protein